MCFRISFTKSLQDIDTSLGGASGAQDPLLEMKSLKWDVEKFKSLGINILRIYNFDNSKNYNEGMKILHDAGAYVALDVNTPDHSLSRETGATLHRSYNDSYLQSVLATIDAPADSNDLLLFFSGNEVVNEKNNNSNNNTAPFIKATIRDMKQ